MPPSLNGLPNEILYLILDHLSCTPPPSFTRIHAPPSLDITRSAVCDLKSFARTSFRFAELMRPLLFAHSCCDVTQVEQFLSFINKFELQRYVSSIVVTARASDGEDLGDDASWWCRLLTELNPLRLTFLAAPTIIGQATATQITDGHSWAFDIPYQILHLEQDPNPRHQPKPTLDGTCPSLLHARSWTSICFNEASSLKAYHHYEYYHHRVPSIFETWGNPNNTPSHIYIPITHIHDPHKRHLHRAFENVTHFRYTAVFPFYNHIRVVLDVMRALMPNLQSLTVQLAPDRNNRVIENEQRGSLDPNDPWMEVAQSYSFIAHMVRDLAASGGNLVRFQACDFDIEALRANVSAIVEEVLPWTEWRHDGRGIWTVIKTDENKGQLQPGNDLSI
ncbi:hypothetical protein BGW36DRAFT_360734 [Talaromyces proteolyticus]|uniref:F-box domain-containing protein n=1 Tax=Talaromyces proteolyticus TaxID=1131652 RepID=A0AAD4KNW9_9EURO|nr:uncharacterized protein BGW36DRAFT_360734 [Talaromyces proteolyticus]KAH8695018.1 hypothetical protein BGW36DRAFT_360734 [Talaromyces proteolyticus]